jgi:hypothetical protein
LWEGRRALRRRGLLGHGSRVVELGEGERSRRLDDEHRVRVHRVRVLENWRLADGGRGRRVEGRGRSKKGLVVIVGRFVSRARRSEWRLAEIDPLELLGEGMGVWSMRVVSVWVVLLNRRGFCGVDLGAERSERRSDSVLGVGRGVCLLRLMLGIVIGLRVERGSNGVLRVRWRVRLLRLRMLRW